MVHVHIRHGARYVRWECTAVVGCICRMSHLRDMPPVSSMFTKLCCINLLEYLTYPMNRVTSR